MYRQTNRGEIAPSEKEGSLTLSAYLPYFAILCAYLPIFPILFVYIPYFRFTIRLLPHSCAILSYNYPILGILYRYTSYLPVVFSIFLLPPFPPFYLLYPHVLHIYLFYPSYTNCKPFISALHYYAVRPISLFYLPMCPISPLLSFAICVTALFSYAIWLPIPTRPILFVALRYFLIFYSHLSYFRYTICLFTQSPIYARSIVLVDLFYLAIYPLSFILYRPYI